MRIGVLSDTHLADLGASAALAQQLMAGPFADVEAVIHAGDMVVPDLASCFYPLPCYAVRGNMDRSDVDSPDRRILSLNEKRIGVIHGWGAPEGLERRVLGAFGSERLDVLVFGHSHLPVCRYVGGVLLLNPGSPTDRRRAAHHTVALLTLTEEVTAEIIVMD